MEPFTINFYRKIVVYSFKKYNASKSILTWQLEHLIVCGKTFSCCLNNHLVWPPTAWLKTTSRLCWRRKPCGMLQAASCRSTKVMALFAFSTTSITHSFNLVTKGRSCSLQSPAERDGIGWGAETEIEWQLWCGCSLKYVFARNHTCPLSVRWNRFSRSPFAVWGRKYKIEKLNTNYEPFKGKHGSDVNWRNPHTKTQHINLCAFDSANVLRFF